MAKRSRIRQWSVTIQGLTTLVMARTMGAAIAKARRELRLASQPQTEVGGGWKDVSAAVV